MNILLEVGGELFKMFVGDPALTFGILLVVALTDLLIRFGAVPPLLAGVVLFIGCIVVLAASVALAVWRHRDH